MRVCLRLSVLVAVLCDCVYAYLRVRACGCTCAHARACGFHNISHEGSARLVEIL